MNFKNKINKLFYIVILCVLFLTAFVIKLFIKALVENQMEVIMFAGTVSIILILVSLFTVSMVFIGGVNIDDKIITIRIGLIKTTIDIKTITNISKDSSCISSMALSFDRICIKYNRWDIVYISVVDNDLFMKEVKKMMNIETILK